MKYSLDEVRKIPPKILLKLIERAKKYLKTNDVFKDMCKEYNVDTGIIEIIPMKFGDIEVSARTEKGIITLNYKLLCDGDFIKDYGYAVHEIQHWLDQCYGKKPTPGADEGDYLHNPAEIKGFQAQIEYIDDEFGDQEAENYVDHLLDHHDKKGKDRNELKEVLMEKVED
jgi:hypothetical protein